MNPANPTANDPAHPLVRTVGSRGLNRWRTCLGTPHAVALLLVVVTIALFWPAVGHPFMAIDDSEYVTEHPLVPQGLTWLGAGFAFTARHSGNWHPLTTLSHMLDCQLFGLDPAGHHLVNILLHALNAALVFWVLRLMTGSLWRSAIVAALFALHPLRVESVAWVSERKDVLSVFFFLLALWAYGRHAQARSPKSEVRSAETPARRNADARSSVVRPPSSAYYWLALLCSALGLMSKPMLVTLPFVLLLLDYWPLNRFRSSDLGFRMSSVRRLWPLVREKLPFLGLSFLVAFITSQVQQGAMAELKVLPVSLRIVNMFVAYGQYLAQTFWPANLAVVYPYNLTPPAHQVAAAAMLILALSVLAWLWRDRQPWVAVGWLWFLGTLIPVIGLVQVGIQAHADRYTYLPSIGLLWLVVWTAAHFAGLQASSRRLAVPGVKQSPGGSTVQRLLLVLPALVVLVLAVLTRAQVAHWEDTEKLMRHTERVAGSSELVRGSLGAFYYREGRLEEAETQYRLGLQLDGDAWPSVIGLANVYAAQDKPAEAERLYRRALAGRPNPAYHFVLADFLQDQNRLDEARVHYLQGLARAPYHANARNQLGNVHARQANWPAAREQYERSLKLNPKVAGTWYNLGRVLMAQGTPGEAITHFTKALELQPAFSPAHNSLGYALALQGRPDEAIQHYEKALADKPDFAEAHFNLAEALARRGALELARTHFEAALQFQTNYAKAHVGLAGVFAAGRRPAPVVHHLREAIRLDPANPDPLNNLAWLLATHPDAAFRDGPEAVRLAARAVELTRTNDVEVLDTLAAAHAEAGQFSQAVVVAQQALELAGRGGPTNQLAAISSRLELYRQRVAHREP